MHYCMDPEVIRESRLMQHAPHHVHECPVHLFSNPVLLWCVGYCSSMSNASTSKVVVEGMADKFATVVTLEVFDPFSNL